MKRLRSMARSMGVAATASESSRTPTSLAAAVSTFDTSFSLPAASVTKVLADTTTPGTNSDETEALVDIEWAHAAAPGAPINSVSRQPGVLR